MESTNYVGMDVHKDTVTIAVMNSAGKVVMESSTVPPSWKKLCNGVRQGSVQVLP